MPHVHIIVSSETACRPPPFRPDQRQGLGHVWGFRVCGATHGGHEGYGQRNGVQGEGEGKL